MVRCLCVLIGFLWLTPAMALNEDTSHEAACAALAQRLADEPDIRLTAIPKLSTDETLPVFCQVLGKVVDKIGFEMRLPLLQAWNGRFLLAGCGGFCGQLLPDKSGYANSINEALKRGYAAMAHDSGHQSDSTADTRWARGNDPMALELWAHRALPALVDVGQSIIKAYYHREPEHRFFSGCSNGGRLGLIAAQRHPELFDAIAAGGPILDLSGNAGIQGAWMIQQVATDDGASLLSPQQLERLADHVTQSCDRLDGVVDQVIAKPELCQPNLALLQCTHDPSAGCLNEWQIERIAALYKGAHVGDTSLFPGIPPGSEHLWPIWITGLEGQPAWGHLAAQGFLDIYRQMPADQHVDAQDIDVIDEAQAMATSPLALMANATDTDLSAHIKARGKLLIWHGWSDPLILPQRTTQYFEQASQHHGEGVLEDHMQLFMVPGHGHCWEAPGIAPDLFDPVQVLEAWVDDDKPPRHIIARDHIDPETATATALLCAYPEVATHDGIGPINHASSYHCIVPIMPAPN